MGPAVDIVSRRRVSVAIHRSGARELIVPAGLVVLLVILPLSDGGRTSLARALCTTSVFLLLALLLISREGPAFVHALPLRWLALVGCFLTSSLFVSIFKDLSMKDALTLLTILGGGVLAAHVVRKGHERLLLSALLLSGVLTALLAAPTYLTAPSGSSEASALAGSFHYPNGLGSFLLLIGFLPFPFLFHGRRRLTGLLPLSALALLWTAMILTHSRGVWAAGLITVAFWTVCEYRLIWAHRGKIAVAVLLIVGLVLIASRRPAELAPHLLSLSAATAQKTPDPSFQWRRDIYAWTLQIIKDHPWVGTGIGTFSIAIKRYQRAPYVTGLYAHNHYLQTGAEMGLPALAGLLLLLGFLLRQGFRIIASLPPQCFERSQAVCLVAGLLSSSLHAAVDLGWSYPAVLLVVAVEAAILVGVARPVCVRSRTGRRSVLGEARLKAIRPAALACCLMIVLLAGTRYYAEIFRNVGRLALEAGDRGRAVAALQWSARLNPLFSSPRQLLASAYAAQGDLQGSGREAERALRLSPFDGDAYQALASIHWLAGEHDKAEADLLSAVRLQPYARLSVYHDLAELYLAMGRPFEAQVWLERGAGIFTPQLVTDRWNRCLAPGDRYLLARIYARIAEVWRDESHPTEAAQAEAVAARLAKPAMEEICARGMTGRLHSPESTIIAYWESRSRRDFSGVMAAIAPDASQALKDESLKPLPDDIETVAVDGIISLVGNEEVATLSYGVQLLTKDAQARRATFTDTLLMEGGGWRLRLRANGRN